MCSYFGTEGVSMYALTISKFSISDHLMFELKHIITKLYMCMVVSRKISIPNASGIVIVDIVSILKIEWMN